MAQNMENSKRSLFLMSFEGAGNKGIKLAGNGCFPSLRHPALSPFGDAHEAQMSAVRL
jgi:hypothetical protein